MPTLSKHSSLIHSKSRESFLAFNMRMSSTRKIKTIQSTMIYSVSGSKINFCRGRGAWVLSIFYSSKYRITESESIDLQWLMETEEIEFTYTQNTLLMYIKSVFCVRNHPHSYWWHFKDKFIEKKMSFLSLQFKSYYHIFIHIVWLLLDFTNPVALGMMSALSVLFSPFRTS